MKHRKILAFGAALAAIYLFTFRLGNAGNLRDQNKAGGAIGALPGASDTAVVVPEPVAEIIPLAATDTPITKEEYELIQKGPREPKPSDEDLNAENPPEINGGDEDGTGEEPLPPIPRPRPKIKSDVKSGLGGDGTVTLYHVWSKETISLRYREEDGSYAPGAAEQIKHFFRCRVTGKEMDIPIKLIEILDSLQDAFNSDSVTVICGYRSPEFNAARAADSQNVAKTSLHMKGWAADIRIPGAALAELKAKAKALKAGGVGYYPSASDNFVHVDVGRVRYW